MLNKQSNKKKKKIFIRKEYQQIKRIVANCIVKKFQEQNYIISLPIFVVVKDKL